MKFDSTLSIGDLINFIIVISGIIAIYLQYRSVRLAEKELQSKVAGMQEIISELEKEKQERIAQIEERKQEHHDLNSLVLEKAESLTWIAGKIDDINSDSQQSLGKQLAAMHEMFVILATICENIILTINDSVLKIPKETIHERVPALNVLYAMKKKNVALIERNNHLVIFYEKIKNLGSGVEKELKISKTQEGIDSITNKFSTELEILTNQWHKEFDSINSEFLKMQDSLNEKLTIFYEINNITRK